MTIKQRIKRRIAVRIPANLSEPPEPIRSRPQWLGWHYEQRALGKASKVPIGSTDDRTTWSTFDDVQKAVRQDRLDGVGFVFSSGDPFAGVDLDGCRDPESGDLEPWAKEIVEDLASYTEVSPSGTGVKIWLEATKPAGTRCKWFPIAGDRNRAIEVYDQGRYFTWTGRALPKRTTIRRRQAALERLCATAPSATEITDDELATIPPKQLSADDAAILRQLPGTAYHRFFIATRPPGHDDSAADFQMACELAKVAGNDIVRIERLMRASSFGRTKWDRGGDSYLLRTIRAAVASTYKDRFGASTPDKQPLSLLSVREVAWERGPKEKLPYLAWSGFVTLFAGREKDGKTTLASWAVVQGALAGYETVWLSTDERPAMIGGRFVKLADQFDLAKQDRDALLDRIRVLSRDPRNWAEVQALWSGGWRPEVIVVDTLASFLMAVDGKVPQTSEGELWQAKVLQFKEWIEGCQSAAVVLLAHANKTDGDVRGSTGIGAAPDAIVTYRGDHSDPSVRCAERRGRFGIGNDKIFLRYLGDDTPSFEEVEQPASKRSARLDRPFGRSATAGKLLDILLAAGDSGLGEADWRRAAESEGLNPKASFNRGRDRLREAGLARNVDGRWYGAQAARSGSGSGTEPELETE